MTTMMEKMAAEIDAEIDSLLGDPNALQQGAADRIARAALLAIREPIDGWLAHQIEHGHAPDGHSVEMSPRYAAGRLAAFQSTKAMIDAILNEKP